MFRAKSGHQVTRSAVFWYGPGIVVGSNDRELTPMPRSTELALRLALDRMLRHGATASDIARQLGLPLSTVRGLVRHLLQAGADRTVAAVPPHYHACGPRPSA